MVIYISNTHTSSICVECLSTVAYIHAFRIFKNTRTHMPVFAEKARRTYVLLFSHPLLNSFPPHAQFCQTEMRSYSISVSHVRLLILWCFDPDPSLVFSTLFGQNFRFVLGGLSRCFNCSIPHVRFASYHHTRETLKRVLFCAHFSLHNSPQLSLAK